MLIQLKYIPEQYLLLPIITILNVFGLLLVINNKVLIQFGKAVGNKTNVITLPKAYSNNKYSITATTIEPEYYLTHIQNKTTTSFTTYQYQSANGGVGNKNFNWISIGY